MTIRQQLWEIAADQYGYVTTSDAAELGIAVIELGKLAHRGKLERVHYGIYRLPEIPVSDLDPYMLAVLWAGGRGHLSHDTVLSLRRLCDVNPVKIHLTVPTNYEPRRKGGELYRVHQQDLTHDEIDYFEGIPAVSITTAIAQALTTLPHRLTKQASDNAAAAGLISADYHDHVLGRLQDNA
ncbi:MAG: type IV toxin-antitoxin system AbiEi family antitoxin domain-containing protein [Nitriliruptor sp.]|uniref:type IV toxin-antitoxin system AbiEi family antitoxin domain-containing protein n=1 Tax=Nitriliruptor sp. TaxID=2448056 RepID=UPI0034A0A867